MYIFLDLLESRFNWFRFGEEYRVSYSRPTLFFPHLWMAEGAYITHFLFNSSLSNYYTFSFRRPRNISFATDQSRNTSKYPSKILISFLFLVSFLWCLQFCLIKNVPQSKYNLDHLLWLLFFPFVNFNSIIWQSLSPCLSKHWHHLNT